MQIITPPARITDAIWMLGTREYPVYFVKEGTQAAIFEGGVGAVGPVVKGQLAGLGILPEEVRYIVVTHAHPDHVMAVPMFRHLFPQAEVCASNAAAGTLAVAKAISFFCKIDESLTGALLKAGSITEAHKPEPLTAMEIAVDRTLSEGDQIRIGNASLEVMETPGHSDCSLSFHQPDTGVLIISDASGYYLPDCGYWWPNYFSSYGDYLTSLKRLQGLGAEVLCLSHNLAITGRQEVGEYFNGAIAATETCHQRIVAEFKAGKSPRDIAGDLGEDVYAKTQLLPLDFFQKNCSILVKKSLGHEGLGE